MVAMIWASRAAPNSSAAGMRHFAPRPALRPRPAASLSMFFCHNHFYLLLLFAFWLLQASEAIPAEIRSQGNRRQSTSLDSSLPRSHVPSGEKIPQHGHLFINQMLACVAGIGSPPELSNKSLPPWASSRQIPWLPWKAQLSPSEQCAKHIQSFLDPIAAGRWTSIALNAFARG